MEEATPVMTVRQVRMEEVRAGLSPRILAISTTLLGPILWPATLPVLWYERRWRVELSFEDIKTTMERKKCVV